MEKTLRRIAFYLLALYHLLFLVEFCLFSDYSTKFYMWEDLPEINTLNRVQEVFLMLQCLYFAGKSEKIWSLFLKYLCSVFFLAFGGHLFLFYLEDPNYRSEHLMYIMALLGLFLWSCVGLWQAHRNKIFTTKTCFWYALALVGAIGWIFLIFS